MTSILETGKYRPRKEWSTTTNDLSEIVNDDNNLMESHKNSNNNNNNHHNTSLPPKPPRRSSLAIGLLAGRLQEKTNKRRSSIAVTFLGRKDSNEKLSKDSSSNYESAVKSEKSDGSQPTSPSDIFYQSHERIFETTTTPKNILNLNNKLNESDEYDDNNENLNDNKNNIIKNQTSADIYSSGGSNNNNNSGQRRNSKQITKIFIDKRRRKNSEIQQLLHDNFRRKSSSITGQQQNGNDSFNEITSIQESGDDIEGYHNHHHGHREKRHSWWNIFIPDHMKQRSRRASQDVGVISRSADNITTPVRRSKSRSVDHGLSTPVDLDSLRSKVEGRFESVDRLTKDGDKKKTSLPTIPTITYTVGSRDTLTSVAARFDTTPSELTHLNRLNSSFIYPGQQLLVPDKSAKDDASSTSDSTSVGGSGSSGGGGGINDEKGGVSPSGKSSPVTRKKSEDGTIVEEKDILEGLRPGSPKPGHIKRVTQTKDGITSDPADDPVITQRFLKINVRHITDGQGVVGGVLLVTPNAVMFDPNVSDPLVIEHGPEHYGVIAPMELVVNAAIFHDIAHMRVAGGETSNEKVEVYYPKTCNRSEDSHSPGKDSLLVKDETFPELGSGSVEMNEDEVSVCSSTGRDGDAFPKAFERERVTPNQLDKEHSQSIDKDKLNEKETKESDEKKSLSTDKRTAEERRKSLLDHHWAIPSKDRKMSLYNSQRSSDDENDTSATVTTADIGKLNLSSSLSLGQQTQSTITTTTTTESIAASSILLLAASGSQNNDDDSQLSKQSCYDSGIDICDPNTIPIVQPIPTKKVYSDADIVLSSDWVPPRTISPTQVSESPPKSQGSTHSGSTLSQTHSLDTTAVGGGVVNRKKTSSVSFSVEDNEQSQSSQSSEKSSDQNKKNKMLKRLSYPLTWVEGLTGEGGKPSETESAPNTGDSNQSVFSKVFSSSPITLVSELGGNLFLSKTPSEDSGGSPVPPITPHSDGHATPGRSSIATFMRPHSSEGSQPSTKSNKTNQPKLDYRSMVSIDDMPELFVSFDMRAPLFPQLEQLELIPRPARACPDPPLYLRLRMGKPIGKAIPLPTSVMSYGKNKLRPEYWFSVPKNRVDELYRFIHTWVPHLYGELDEEAIKIRGFELIQHDTEWAQGSPSKEGRRSSDGEDITELTRESWELLKAPYVKIYNVIKTVGSHDLDLLGGEVLSMSTDDYRKASLFATGSFDLDFPIPDLIGETEILTEEHREKLCGHLPARAEGYSWTLVFSTSQHGFSLNSLYRKMQRLESPILIVIEDTDHNVFGALTSCSLHVSDHFYGTGESLLYKFNPTFKVFHWTGENLYFIKGNPESLSIGAGDGKFGLWLDGDLNLGRTQTCSTYANEPLAPQEDFVVKTFECWAFV